MRVACMHDNKPCLGKLVKAKISLSSFSLVFKGFGLSISYLYSLGCFTETSCFANSQLLSRFLKCFNYRTQ